MGFWNSDEYPIDWSAHDRYNDLERRYLLLKEEVRNIMFHVPEDCICFNEDLEGSHQEYCERYLASLKNLKRMLK